MVEGLGVSAALIIAPMYILEIAHAKYRDRMVSLNQQNIVLGIVISFVGLINSGVSFKVQLVFLWQLASIRTIITFVLYGIFAIITLGIILRYWPETKGKSLEALESMLVNAQANNT